MTVKGMSTINNANWFLDDGSENLTSFKFIDFDATNCTSFKNMFYNCPNLEVVYGLETISNTRNVNSMESMFDGCSSLLSSQCGNCYIDQYYFTQKSMDITNLDTYNVTNMDKMFSGC